MTAGPAHGTFLTRSWGAVAQTGAPLIRSYLRYRASQGKEDASRLSERFGKTHLPRPTGTLYWIHAASVGEANSVLALIEQLLTTDAAAHVMLTTGTVTSAELMAGRLPPRAFHQYAPFDRPDWVKAFLDHWHPDVGAWVESELWPTLITTAHAHGVPMALINARMSKKSHRGWTRWRKTAAALLDAFDVILAQDDRTAERLRNLGARNVEPLGNIKLAAAPLACDEAELAALKSALGDRPRWLAASVHKAEEAALIEAHTALRAKRPGLVTIIAPRQPNRGAPLAEAARAAGLETAQRSVGEPLTPASEIYVADTIGEMGLFFRLAPVAFMGRSLVDVGGSNPLEAPPLGCAVVTGPHTDNFSSLYDKLTARGGVTTATDASTLTEAVEGLLADEPARQTQIAAALTLVAEAHEVLDRTACALTALAQRSPDAAA